MKAQALSATTEPVLPEGVLLSVRGLGKHHPVMSKGFFARQTGVFKACDDVSFDLKRGETLGIVGESGSGKTTLGRSILRATAPSVGRLAHGLVEKLVALKPLRTELQMIFQDPFSSLNPRMTVQQIVEEPLFIHGLADTAEREARVVAMLQRVGIRPEYRARYPHAFSGGQRQRIGIARALVLQPALVVADEAVSALDVSVQAQVVNLLADLQEEYGLTYLFIAHDLAVVRHLCDRVGVMTQGRLVELAETETLFTHPQHAYTQRLLAAMPDPDPDHRPDWAGQGVASLSSIS